MASAGFCFSTGQCQDGPRLQNLSLFGMSECCSLSWGRSWRNATSGLCFTCSREPLKGEWRRAPPSLTGLVGERGPMGELTLRYVRGTEARMPGETSERILVRGDPCWSMDGWSHSLVAPPSLSPA